MTTTLEPTTAPAVRHDLTAAIERDQRNSARSRQRDIGASDIGTCRRRTAYKLAGVRGADEGSKLAAAMGTWLHKGAQAVLRKHYGAHIEVLLKSPYLKGHADAVYLEQQPDGTWVVVVEDIKTKGRFAYDKVCDRGPRMAEWFQVHIYAWMLANGYAADRRKGYPQPGTAYRVTHVRLRFLNRDTGESHIVEAPYDPAVASEALAWLGGVLEALDTTGVDSVPQDGYGPGVSVICDYCPFVRTCWGEPDLGPAARAVQSRQVRDDADTAAALAEYRRGADLESQGKAIKANARALLDASPPGVYGGVQLRWSERASKQVPDPDAAVELLADMGVPVPMTYTKPGRTISVRKAPTGGTA